MKITLCEINAQTGEEIFSEREMTAKELKDRDESIAEGKAQQAEAESKATAKAALLEKLGITSEEAALLLS